MCSNSETDSALRFIPLVPTTSTRHNEITARNNCIDSLAHQLINTNYTRVSAEISFQFSE